MTNNQLNLIRSIAENRLADAKKYAICCCVEDTTQKNRVFVQRYKNVLENGSSELMELPFNIQGKAHMEDVSKFRADRYYLSSRESILLDKIKKMNEAGLKLMELGIPYLNAILLTGVSGTGKTTFGRYVAHCLGLPFLYVNFSHLIDSAMGSTSKNMRNVFGFARLNKCIFMLDEIDCIAQSRGSLDGSAGKELSNITISLLQELDQINNDSIIIGATNIPKVIDAAVLRRFSIKHEVTVLDRNECVEMIMQYLNTIDSLKYNQEEIESYADNIVGKPQAVVMNHIIESIAESIINDSNEVHI